MTVQVKIWDVPTRLFHWTLVGLFGVMWYTGEQGGEALQQHFLAGYAIATLVIFRLIWGVLGSDTARFSQFVRGPSAVMAYLRGTLPEHEAPGHNPMGGLMVLAMLALLAFQVGTGLCASDIDAYLWDGPLAKRIGADLSETITGWHKAAFDVLLMAVITHVTAIVFYLLFKKRNLVKAMLTGQQIFDAPVQRLAFVRGSIALLALLVAAGAVYGLVTQV